MKQTYTEKKGKAPFNWRAFLKKKRHSIKELDRAVGLSRGWVTCACGNQCSVIKRSRDGQPEDYYLAGLGSSFFYHVRLMYESRINWPKLYEYERHKLSALKVLDRIEERSGLLIAYHLVCKTGKIKEDLYDYRNVGNEYRIDSSIVEIKPTW